MTGTKEKETSSNTYLYIKTGIFWELPAQYKRELSSVVSKGEKGKEQQH